MKRMIAVLVTTSLFTYALQTSVSADPIDRLYEIPSGPPVDTQVETWLETNTGSVPLSFSPFNTSNSIANRALAANSFDTVLGTCSAQVSTGCIESIRYSINGQTWYLASLNQTLQQRHMAYGTYTGDPNNPWDMQLTSTWSADPSLGLFQASLPNELSLSNAPHSLGSDYLINATVKSELVDGVAVIKALEVEAIAGLLVPDDDDRNVFNCQGRHVSNELVDPIASYCYETNDLPENLQLEVNIQLGSRISELSGWFDGRLLNPTIVFGTDASPGLVSVKGSPLKVNYFETNPVPITDPLFNVPDEINEMQRQGGIGTRGAWSPRTGLEEFLRLESFVPTNSAEIDTVWKLNSWTRDVGIDECASNPGIQGIVITNATTYSPNPPSFNSETGKLEFRVAYTHYLPDNTTLNRGYYNLILQESLANCLWGTGNAMSASIEVKELDGQSNSAQTNIQIVDGWVNFTAENFHFSAPEILIGFKSPTSESVNTPTGVAVNTPTAVAVNTPAAVASAQTPSTALPATIKAKKSIKVSAKSSAGLPIKVKVKGSCTVKSNTKTTVTKVGKKKVKTKTVVSYSVKLGKKGKTCTVTQTSPSNGSVSAMNSVSVIKIR